LDWLKNFDNLRAEVREGVKKIRIATIENEAVRISIAPEHGAKIVELIDIRGGYQWLWTDPSRPIRRAIPTDLYADHDVTGIDECFPNIGVSAYPGDEHLLLPDHGELWSREWEVEVGDTWLRTVTAGSTFRYTFARVISLQGSLIKFEYEIKNLGSCSFLGFWTLHALFRAEADMIIAINGNPTMTKEFGFSSRMGEDGTDGYGCHLDTYQWPLTAGATGETHDLSRIVLDPPLTDKVVLQTPVDGTVQLINTRIGRSITFRVDANEIPFIGICYNLGAWPFTGEKATWVAIEPSQGATDKLDESTNLGAAVEFQPGVPFNFSFSMQLG